MAKYKPMPRREEGDVIANSQGMTFGKMMKDIRESRSKSLRSASGEIGISPAYLSDIENDRRYPPVGEVLDKMLSVYKVSPEDEYEIMDLIGIARKELAPDMVEFLRGSEFAREIVRKLMAVSKLDGYVIDHEDKANDVMQAVQALTGQK